MSDTTGTILDGMPEALKQAAETVRAADDLISAVSGLVPTDSRSIVVEIDNLTKHTLSNVTGNFAHGGFGPTLPQALIGPMKADVFSVISDGIATGVEGSRTYLSDGVDGLLMGFDDPFLGGNTVNVTVSPALSSELNLVAAISTGNRAHARYVLFPKDLRDLPQPLLKPLLIFRFNPGATPPAFGQVNGQLARIAVGAGGAVWGLDAAGLIFRFNGAAFEEVSGQLAQIAVGATSAVWGLNAAGLIFRFNGTAFEEVSGQLAQIAVGSDGAVWGLH